jgi:hypothetical protein
MQKINRSIYTLATEILATEHPDITNKKKELKEIRTKISLSAKQSALLDFCKRNYFYKNPNFQQENFPDIFPGIYKILLLNDHKYLNIIEESQTNILNKHDNINKRASSGYAVLSLLSFASAAAIHLFADANNPETSKGTMFFCSGIGIIAAGNSFIAAISDRYAVKKTEINLYKTQKQMTTNMVRAQAEQMQRQDEQMQRQQEEAQRQEEEARNRLQEMSILTDNMTHTFVKKDLKDKNNKMSYGS